MDKNDRLKLLVAIASSGTSHERELNRLIEEYSSMNFDVHIVVLSNLRKAVPPGVELSVGLPSKDPWSLPFAHKRLFADRLHDYDLFLYSEDDVLITERNILASLRAMEILPPNDLPGFFRFEESNGERNYPEVHGPFRWDPASVIRRGPDTFAYFTNEHSACYLLTQAQLTRAIASGNFLVEPHKGRYDLPCSAATDPFTQCGFRKLICISGIDDFLVHHLPNKYIGSRFGVSETEFRRQIRSLITASEDGKRQASLFSNETALPDCMFSKNCYEPARMELASVIPPAVKTILSLGCGWGATEAWLTRQGYCVTAVPLDMVIPGGAEAAGVEILYPDFATAKQQLIGRRFDCLLLLNVLHLLPDPVAVLRTFAELLAGASVIICLGPNVARLGKSWGSTRGIRRLSKSGYSTAGMHFASRHILGAWLEETGAELRQTLAIMTPPAQKVSQITFGLSDSALSAETIIRADIKNEALPNGW